MVYGIEVSIMGLKCLVLLSDMPVSSGVKCQCHFLSVPPVILSANRPWSSINMRLRQQMEL